MRGLAVVIMIQCHTINSLTRMDLREGGPYVLSQFVGGMAAPLFLFMAGMTSGFQMDSLERREGSPLRRWLISLRRAGYILGIAFLFRLTNYLGAWPNGDASDLTKVDILNCMGVAMALLSAAALFAGGDRTRFAAAAGVAIAAAAPIITNLPWDGLPRLLHEYAAPGFGRGRFAFFPNAAYLAFGIAAGGIVKRIAAERMDRLMQWSVLLGFGMIFVAQYFANLPYSVYPKSNFWTDSPALISIRTGICLLMMAGAYLWTEFCSRKKWSWMEVLGKNSLMVYWVHVMLVYGAVVRPIKRKLDIPQVVLASLIVTALMVALSTLWLQWKTRRTELRRVRQTPAHAHSGSV
jgi:Heparan-alpha-glucosaminide N-acetyltransferase, catalytic